MLMSQPLISLGTLTDKLLASVAVLSLLLLPCNGRATDTEYSMVQTFDALKPPILVSLEKDRARLREG